MGLSVKGKINGDSMQSNKLDGTLSEDDIEDSLDPLFHNGSFITLREMIIASIIIAQNDATTTSERGKKIPYDLDNSGVLIKFANSLDEVIAPSAENRAIDQRTALARVHDIHVFVNLAGTSDIICVGSIFPCCDYIGCSCKIYKYMYVVNSSQCCTLIYRSIFCTWCNNFIERVCKFD
jgi:hypothetical protein